jgi:hypothetical protein
MPQKEPPDSFQLILTGSVINELVRLYEHEADALCAALADWLVADNEQMPAIELRLCHESDDAGEQQRCEDGSHLISLLASASAHSRHTLAHELCHVAQGVLDVQPNNQAEAIPGEFLAERHAGILARAAQLAPEVIEGSGPAALVCDAAAVHSYLTQSLGALVGEADFRAHLQEELGPRFWAVLRYAAYAAGAAVALEPRVFERGNGPFDAPEVDLPDWARSRFAGIVTPWARAAAELPLRFGRADFAAWRAAVNAQFTSTDPADLSDGFDAYINNAMSLYLYDQLAHLSGLGTAASELRDELHEFYYGT